MNDSISRNEVDDRDYRRIMTFVYDEADLFDDGEYATWLERLTPDIRYKMPVRGVFEKGREKKQKFDNGFFDDDFDSLALRISLWSQASTTVAESPPSITRHFVSNVRAYQGEVAGSFEVTSNVLVFRIRATSSTPHLFSCRRTDLLREVDGELKLASRLVKKDEPVVQS
ncbi:MAG: aromatic-ring-hydroxylating dioxygenase subunit beta, partial [Gammaproteobacteria bacterium]